MRRLSRDGTFMEGLQGRGFLRILEILMGNKAYLRDPGPGIWFSENSRVLEGD